MLLSDDTERRYAEHRPRTHNAGVLAETLAGSDCTPTHYEPLASEGAEERGQKRGHSARPAGPSVGQRSSAVEHPTHNGKVAGAAPAAGIAVVSPQVALTLALASQEPRQSQFTWHLVRVHAKTGAPTIIGTRTAPDRTDAVAQFAQQWGKWPSDVTVVAAVAMATFRPFSRNRVKWQRGANR